jgi:phosphatidate cytidylyltransferase
MPVSLYLAVWLLFLIGAGLIFLSHCIRRAPRADRAKDWTKLAVYFAWIHALLLAAAAGRGVLAVLLCAIVASGAREIAHAFPGPQHRGRRLALVALVGFGLAHVLLPIPGAGPAGVAWLIVVVSATDSFAQIGGRIFGRRRLCPSVSPAKTVEGLVVGVMAATGLAIGLGFLLPGIARRDLVILGLLTAGGAVAGDLLFSRIKRCAGVKDFSQALPGHGGVLDRCDSLVVAAPIHAWSQLVLGLVMNR